LAEWHGQQRSYVGTLLRLHIVSTTFTTLYTIPALFAYLSADNALSVNLSSNNASPANEPAPVRYAECNVQLCASARESVENWHLASPLSIEQPVYDVGFVEAMKAAKWFIERGSGWVRCDGATHRDIHLASVQSLFSLLEHCSMPFDFLCSQ
jgi:hypothetical protein